MTGRQPDLKVIWEVEPAPDGPARLAAAFDMLLRDEQGDNSYRNDPLDNFGPAIKDQSEDSHTPSESLQ